MNRRRVATAAVVSTVLVVSACGGGSGAATPDGGVDRLGSTTTSTTTSAPTTSTSSTTTTTSTSTIPPIWDDATGCVEPSEWAEPDPHRPRYTASIDLDPGRAEVAIAETVEFTPDLPIDELVLRLWANSPRLLDAGTGITVESVTGPLVETFSVPDPTTLRIALTRPVAAGETVVFDLGAGLVVPGPVRDRVSRSAGSMRLGSVLPVLPWEPGRGWAVEPATSAFAEAATTPVADFVVDVTSPPGVEVLATGREVDPGRWEATAVRDFALSAGRFATASASVAIPEPVTVTVAVHETVAESADDYLTRIVHDLGSATDLLGPYPWPSFSMAVTPDLEGGIEFPSHVMQGPDSLGRTTPHEVAHQWFYGLVGNNQARDPWMDEGLATYVEGRLEGTLESMSARSIPDVGRGRAGEPMTFWEVHQDAYYRSVYVQTAAALASLGPIERVDCALANHVARSAHAISSPADLVESFEPLFPDVEAALAAYGLGSVG